MTDTAHGADHDTGDATDGQRTNDAITATRRSVLTGATSGLLVAGAGTATAEPDPTGQVGRDDQPLERLYTAALAGGLTDGETVTRLTGEALGVDDGALSAADARLTVTDGETTVENVEAVTFGANFTVSGDGAGVTVDR